MAYKKDVAPPASSCIKNLHIERPIDRISSTWRQCDGISPRTVLSLEPRKTGFLCGESSMLWKQKESSRVKTAGQIVQPPSISVSQLGNSGPRTFLATLSGPTIRLVDHRHPQFVSYHCNQFDINAVYLVMAATSPWVLDCRDFRVDILPPFFGSFTVVTGCGAGDRFLVGFWVILLGRREQMSPCGGYECGNLHTRLNSTTVCPPSVAFL
jgi:hypothetical protein